MYFQSFSEWFIGFKATFPHSKLEQLRITAFRQSRVTFEKLVKFLKYVFSAIVQIYFQSFPE